MRGRLKRARREHGSRARRRRRTRNKAKGRAEPDRRWRHRPAPTEPCQERIAKSTRARRVRIPDLAREHGESRSAGHGHVIAAGPCLLPVDTLFRTILKLTTQSNHESRKRSNGLFPHVLGGRWESGLVSLVVSYAFLVTCRRPCTRSPLSKSTHQMDKIKRGYKKVTSKAKYLLRPPSRQGALTTPARSPRSSQEPSATYDQGISSTPSAIGLASQTVITPTAVDTPGADVPALEAPAPAPEPSPQPQLTSDTASTYEKPLPAPPKLDDVASVCDPLLTVMHSASDAFPLLKLALVEILEIWKQCEVRRLLPRNLFPRSDCNSRRLPRLKLGSRSSRASSKPS